MAIAVTGGGGCIKTGSHGTAGRHGWGVVTAMGSKIEKASSQSFSEELLSGWDSVVNRLRVEVGEAAFQSWLKPMRIRDFSDGSVEISVPTRFMRDWAAAHYRDRLIELWQTENSEVNAEIGRASCRERV